MHNPRWRRTLYSAWIAQLASITAFSFVWPFTPFYLRDLGIAGEEQLRVWTGMVHSSTGLTLLIFSPIWGVIADRFGRKPMVIRAMFAGAVLLVLMGRATSPYHFLSLRLAQGALTGTVAASVALVASITPVQHTGSSMGMMQAAVFAGTALGPYVGGRIAGSFGYRPAFVAAGLLLLLAGVVVAVFAEESFERDESRRKVGIWRVLSLPGFLPVISIAFGIYFANTFLGGVFPLFVENLVRGGSRAVAVRTGEVIAVSGIAAAVSAGLAGKVSDKLGYRATLAAGCVLSGLFVVPQGTVSSVRALMLWRVAFGLAAGSLMPALNSIIKLLVPEEAHGRAYGLRTSAMCVGMTLGPGTGGLLAARYGLSAPFLVTGATLVAVGIWALTTVRPKPAQPA